MLTISANISNSTRKAVYRRDGYRCALCDSTKYLQIHHAVKRSLGGSNRPENLITLCADCHALAHGMNLRDVVDMDQDAMEQAITEYLADYYTSRTGEPWDPLEEGP